MERAFEKQLSTQLEFRRKCFITFCENLFDYIEDKFEQTPYPIAILFNNRTVYTSSMNLIEDIIHDVSTWSLSDLKLYSSNINRYFIDFNIEFVCIK